MQTSKISQSGQSNAAIASTESHHKTSHYRSRIDIYADMLNIIKDGSRKTRIMYQANLSYAKLVQYLKFMSQAGLVEEKQSGIFSITDKGTVLLSKATELQSILKTYEGITFEGKMLQLKEGYRSTETEMEAIRSSLAPEARDKLDTSKNRDRYDIMIKILEVANAPGGRLKAHLMHKANLSYATLSSHLNILLSNNLIEKSQNGHAEIYTITELGRRAISLYRDIQDVLNSKFEHQNFIF